MSGYLSNDHGISGNVVGRAMHTPSLTVGSEAISHETELYARRMQLNGFINAPLESPQHQLTEFNKESHSPIPGVVNPLYASRRSQPSMHWQLPNHQNSLNDEASHSDDSDRTSDYAEPDFASIKHIPLLAQLGIPSQHHLSMLTVHKATALLDTTYAYLRIQPSDSDEYPETLRLVQDLSHHLCVTPSAFEVKGVTFDRKDVVGHGGEAIIYRGQMDGHEVVVREVPMSPTERKRSRGRKIIRLMNREAITHSQLCHSNILQFLGVYHDTPDSPPIVILPFCDGGSLHDLLNNGLIMEVNKFTWIVIGITRGVTYLHSQNPPIIHGDLHPGNVLLDQHGNAYLSDFGFSRIRHEVTRTHTSIKEGGNLRFLAPELSSGTSKDFRTSKESDIFGLAMTFFNAWTGKKPFREMNKNKVQSHFIKGGQPTRPSSTVALGPEVNLAFWDLLVEMWEHEPKKRPLSNYVLNRLEIIFRSAFPFVVPSQTNLQYRPLEAAMASLQLNSEIRNTAFGASQHLPQFGTMVRTSEEHHTFHPSPLHQSPQMMEENSRSEYPTRPAGVLMGAAFSRMSPRLNLNEPSVPQSTSSKSSKPKSKPGYQKGGPRQELNNLVPDPIRQRIDYVTEHRPEQALPWKADVRISGKVWGTGRATKKDDAKDIAAKQAHTALVASGVLNKWLSKASRSS